MAEQRHVMAASVTQRNAGIVVTNGRRAVRGYVMLMLMFLLVLFGSIRESEVVRPVVPRGSACVVYF